MVSVSNLQLSWPMRTTANNEHRNTALIVVLANENNSHNEHKNTALTAVLVNENNSHNEHMQEHCQGKPLLLIDYYILNFGLKQATAK